MNEIIYPSFDDILIYYCDTIKQSGGGMSGIRERSGIQMILELVQNDLYYPSFEEKLTYLVYSLCTGHYFADGNKRISLVVGAHFLIKNRYDKDLLGKIVHFVINGQELDEETKLEVIHAMEKSPLYSE